MNNNFFLMCLVSFSILLTGCEVSDFGDIAKKPLAVFDNAKVKLSENIIIPKITPPKLFDKGSKVKHHEPLKLEDVYSGSLASSEAYPDFITMIRSGVNRDPYIRSIKEQLQGSAANIDVVKAQKEFQVSGSIYGGIEDFSENTRGVAILLNARKLLFDGGKVDAEILSATLESSSASHALSARMNEKAKELSSLWVKLNKYQSLNKKVESRLQVLGPLILQLEQVASAGIGDVSQVAAAQRTVSMIRLTETEVNERLEQAKLDFINAFGMLPKDLTFDDLLISKLVPPVITEEIALNAPAIRASYDSYLASEAQLKSLLAKDKFTVGMEARTSTPYAGSSRDSDESIGLVISKTLFNGGLFDSEVEKARTVSNARLETLKANFRQGEKVIRNAEQVIKSMDKAISLSEGNLKGISDEITYLRQQLLIGGSTLDSILRAEASLYQAEADLISFEAQKRLAKLSIIGTLGLFF